MPGYTAHAQNDMNAHFSHFRMDFFASRFQISKHNYGIPRKGTINEI